MTTADAPAIALDGVTELYGRHRGVLDAAAALPLFARRDVAVA